MRHLLCLLTIAACSHASTGAAPTAPAPTSAPATTAASPPERFDDRVRSDFFDGLRGDAAAMARAMKLCEDTLAKNPRHAEAMVWHGAGVIGQARDAFAARDRARGLELYRKGLAEMDAAVELAPDDVGVRIPRGAVVLAMAPFTPEPERTKLLERGLADYEATYAIQQPYFGTLTLHAREQLLYGLTDGYAHLGQHDKAAAYLEHMKTEAAGSELLPRATARVNGEPVEGPTPCEECHARR